MRNVFMNSLVILCSVALVTSCGNKAEAPTEFVEVEDTAVVEQNETSRLQEAERARLTALEEWDNFSTPDLAFYDVKGHVKKVSDGNNSISFTIDGKVIGKNVKHDSRGHINAIEEYYEHLGYSIEDTYITNNKGQIVRHKCDAEPDGFACDVTYSYNEEGYMVKESGWNDGLGSFTNKYAYKKFDSHGNWTKRMVTTTDEWGSNNPYAETRTITYYPFEE